MFKTVDMDAVDIMAPHDEHLRITKQQPALVSIFFLKNQ